MTGHPQGSNRGLRFAASQSVATSLTITNSTGSVVVGVNSSGATLDGGLKLKNTTGQLTINSTALKAGKNLQVGSKATLFSSNSTGVKLGTKYITGNSTGN